jgi:hypothetical protein
MPEAELLGQPSFPFVGLSHLLVFLTNKYSLFVLFIVVGALVFKALSLIPKTVASFYFYIVKLYVYTV